MLAFSIDYYGIFFGATQSVELFCAYNTPVKEYILSRQFYKADHEWKKIRYYTMEDMNEKPAIPENSEYQVLDIFDDTKIEKEILKILEELANNIFVI